MKRAPSGTEPLCSRWDSLAPLLWSDRALPLRLPISRTPYSGSQACPQHTPSQKLSCAFTEFFVAQSTGNLAGVTVYYDDLADIGVAAAAKTLKGVTESHTRHTFLICVAVDTFHSNYVVRSLLVFCVPGNLVPLLIGTCSHLDG